MPLPKLTPPPKTGNEALDRWVDTVLFPSLKALAAEAGGVTSATVDPALIGGGSTSLHFHSTDRARQNHTGTQTASTISDLAAYVQSLIGSMGSNHGNLSGLAWASSGHTGTASSVAGFSSGGAAEYLTRTGTGTVVAMSVSPAFTGTVTAHYDASTSYAPSGNWVAKFVQGVDNPAYHGVSVWARFGLGSATIFECATGWNGVAGGYYPVFQVLGDSSLRKLAQDGSTVQFSIDDAGNLASIAPAVTWSGNPTHSGNHTFSGTLTGTTLALTDTDYRVVNVTSSHGVGAFTRYTKTDGTDRTWMIGATGSGASIGDNSFALFDETDGSYRWAVDSSGNLGMSIAPVTHNGGARVLHIDSAANGAEVRLTNTATGSASGSGTLLSLVGSDSYLYNLENAFLSFGTNGTERMRIAGDGALTFTGAAVTWSGNPTHSGNHIFSGNFSAYGDILLGDGPGDAISFYSSAISWVNSPTHSGNHTFSGSVSVNGNTTLGNASGDTLTIHPNAVTWQNAPTHSNDHIFSGNISAANLASSTYTPTLTNTTNIGASTSAVCQYSRVGDVVTVSGTVNVDATSAAASTSLGISLPIASNFASSIQASGTCCQEALPASGYIIANAVADRVDAIFLAGSAAASDLHFIFSYRVI